MTPPADGPRKATPRAQRLDDYEVADHASGAGRVRQRSSGEIMHR
jgi:hypothetical protein